MGHGKKLTCWSVFEEVGHTQYKARQHRGHSYKWTYNLMGTFKIKKIYSKIMGEYKTICHQGLNCAKQG